MSLTLFAHQERAVRIAHKIPRFLYALDCGTGKTISMLAVCQAIPMRTLVVCPKSIMRPAWVRDAEHFPTLKTVVLADSSKARRKANIDAAWDIGIINFDQFKSERQHLERAGVRRLIVDESSKMKNHEAQITKELIAFADKCDSVYLLSGTPAPNNVTEYWAQIRAIRRDLSGDLFWKWAYYYATPKKRKVYAKGGSRDVIESWSQTDAQRAAFEAMMSKCSWALRKEDALDLPKQTDVVVRFPLVEEADHYARAVDALRIELDGEDPHKINAEAALMKLRQISGGFVIVDGRPRSIGTSKLDVLRETLDQIGPRPCLIWAEFRHEIDAIRDVCVERGESVEYIDGRTSGDAGAIAARFQEGKTLRLVCHPAAAGHGITLTRASYSIYYSLGFSYELYKQSRDRIHRAGQTMPCTYYILVGEDTVDESALGVVRGKGTAADAIIAALSLYS